MLHRSQESILREIYYSSNIFPRIPLSLQSLVCGKNLKVEKSIHTAYVKAIRSAQHFVYIENQYFLGSSYCWSSHRSTGAYFPVHHTAFYNFCFHLSSCCLHIWNPNYRSIKLLFSTLIISKEIYSFSCKSVKSCKSIKCTMK